MKGRVIVIDMAEDRRSQAARIVDGRLEDLLIDPPQGDTTPRPGEIYWARVDRLTQGGAFVKLGPDHNGFLRETKGIRQGQGLLVQVSSYAEPRKATPVTTRLLYKGHRLIATPDVAGVNVSRQIKDEDERDRLEKIVEEGLSDLSQLPDFRDFQTGVIIRTAARHAERAELLNELGAVVGAHAGFRRSILNVRPGESNFLPNPVYDTSLSEWSDTSVEAVFLPKTEPIHGHSQMPYFISYDCKQVTDLFTSIGHRDPFDHFGVWDEIEKLKSPRADLPSGGWMAIEATRAMVTVDVNTGDGFGQGDAMTANIEAARELPRQLRLRGLGGQVIVDFAPLKKQHRKKIEETLKLAFRSDPIATTLAGWTPLGNFELQRKRERRPLAELLPDA